MVKLDTTLSAKEAARRIGIAYITLRRWLASGEFIPPSGGLWLGDDPRHRKRVWRFTNKDMSVLLHFKEHRDVDGRGRAARIREHVKREHNRRKEQKRMLRRAGAWNARTKEQTKRYRLLRRYTGILVELASQGLYPRDPVLHRDRRRLGVNELGLLDGVCKDIDEQDRRSAVEKLGELLDPER